MGYHRMTVEIIRTIHQVSKRNYGSIGVIP